MTAALLQVIEAASAAGAARAIEALGIHSGEMSYREAQRTYGNWFVRAVNAGQIPCAHTGTRKRYYRLVDILQAKLDDRAEAYLITKQIKTK